MFNGKVIMIVGPRQVGKSTMFHKILDSNKNKKSLWLNCDLKEDTDRLISPTLEDLRNLIVDNRIVVIDEAQRVPNIGLTLKILVENFPAVQFLVTGSSSLNLHNRLDESLTGRKIEYNLFPVATKEIFDDEGIIGVQQRLWQRLIYGSYPEILYTPLDKIHLLSDLTNSYLYKDILEMEGIRKSTTLQKLLVTLALQIGSEVSYNNLSKIVGIDARTIERYIEVLEKCFIVFRLPCFRRNITTELNKSKKIYFYDVGIRNAILNNFTPIEKRNDMGALWENFFLVERMKYNHYSGNYVHTYFWRTKEQQEIDYIEEGGGQIIPFEMKWSDNHSNVRFPKTFLETYNPPDTHVITPENYTQYLL